MTPDQLQCRSLSVCDTESNLCYGWFGLACKTSSSLVTMATPRSISENLDSMPNGTWPYKRLISSLVLQARPNPSVVSCFARLFVNFATAASLEICHTVELVKNKFQCSTLFRPKASSVSNK